MSTVLTHSADLDGPMQCIAHGKIRDLYQVNDRVLLFIATDRISAFDVVMRTGIPNKGALLTLLSAHWFAILSTAIPGLRHHFLSLDLPPQISSNLYDKFRSRSMQVRKFEVFPIEAIVRGYITGSAWKEYQEKGTVHGIKAPADLLEGAPFPGGPIYTPSTKADAGNHDVNIHPDEVASRIGDKYAKRIEELSLSLYRHAQEYALARGIIIADTKFEFGHDPVTDDVVLVDEVLTPDSSRFWPISSYKIGEAQESFDKQYLRDWLVNHNLRGVPDIELPDDVVIKTEGKYKEAFERLIGQSWENIQLEEGKSGWDSFNSRLEQTPKQSPLPCTPSVTRGR